MTDKTLWPLATSICGGLRPPIVYSETQECCGLWPQGNVAASGGKIPYVIKEMVTKISTMYRGFSPLQGKIGIGCYIVDPWYMTTQISGLTTPVQYRIIEYTCDGQIIAISL